MNDKKQHQQLTPQKKVELYLKVKKMALLSKLIKQQGQKK